MKRKNKKENEKDDGLPQVRPEYIRELKKIDKEKGIEFKDIDELRKEIKKSKKS